MGREGTNSITVSEEFGERLKEKAEATKRTVPKLIEWMFDQCFPEPKEASS